MYEDFRAELLENEKKYKEKNKINKIILVSMYVLAFLVFGRLILYIWDDKNQFYIINQLDGIALGVDYQVELMKKYGEIDDYSDYEWKIKNTNVAKINEYGTITPISEGTTEVNVKSKKGRVEKTMVLNVINVEVKSIKFDKSVNLVVGEKYKLEPIINNNENLNSKLNYKSSDSNIVKVDNNGVITAITEGKATITASLNNVNSECEIVVKSKNEDFVQSISFNQNIINIKEGTKTKLNPIITPSNIKKLDLTWSSSNDIVSVDNQGNIIAKKVGQSIVTVFLNNKIYASCTINVTESNIFVKSISIEKNNYNINVNDTIVLYTAIKPSNATDREITWTSSNSEVVKVENGKVTGLKAGTATIIAKTNNGKTASCSVTVNNKTIAVTDVKLNTTQETIGIQDSFTLSATVSPSNATNKSVTWTSSNPAVAKVENGKVTGLKAGTATIIAKTNNGKTASCSVTVNNKTIAVTGVQLNTTQKTIYVQDSFTLSATVSPSNATNKSVTWTSSNPAVAKVENGKVTGLKAGTATITVKTNNGKTASCSVTVNNKTIAVTGVQLNTTQKTIYVQDSFTLSATVSPSNATNKSVTWTSSNPAVAKVENGKVTGLKAGTATITVKTNNGKTASCSVTVNNKTFTNPIIAGADPFMTQKNGYYYTTYTSGKNNIVIYKSKQLHNFAQNKVVVYTTGNNQAVWAPELHFINGYWYIYYADAKDSNARNRRMYVLRSKTTDPQGKYEYLGVVKGLENTHAIDGTVLDWNGQLYFIYSGYSSSSSSQQNLYIATMSNPYTLSSKPVKIAAPYYNWEKQGGLVNEGPQILTKNGVLHIVYSATGASSQYYCLGLLTYKSGNLLNSFSWTKNSNPVFKSANGVYAPGHGSFVKSPDGKEDWLIYHASNNSTDPKTWKRNIRAQKFTWNGNVPNFGSPVATGSQTLIPSGS